MTRSAPKPRRPGPRSAAVLFVRLTEDEHRQIAEAAKREALPVAAWARSRLLLAARSPKARADRSTPT